MEYFDVDTFYGRPSRLHHAEKTMLIKKGMTIKTDFLKGTVKEVIVGKRRGWKDTYYLLVCVKNCRDHIVRLDEIRDWRVPFWMR